MTQPHHHAFNALEAVFHRTVKISRLLPVLLSRGLLSSPTHDWLLAELRDEQNGIKVLTGYLRSKDYDTFVSFIECVFEAGTADLKLMESVREVVNDFDVKNKTTHAERIALIINEYSIKLQDDVDEESRPVEHSECLHVCTVHLFIHVCWLLEKKHHILLISLIFLHCRTSNHYRFKPTFLE